MSVTATIVYQLLEADERGNYGDTDAGGGGALVGDAGIGVGAPGGDAVVGTGGGVGGGGGLVPGVATGGSVSGETDLDRLYAQLQELLNSAGGMGGQTVNYTGGGAGNFTVYAGGAGAGVGAAMEARPLSVKAIVAILLGTMGLLANLSSLVAISRIRNSLTANLRLIVSLCASDMLVSVSLLLKLTHEAHSSQLTDTQDTCLEHVLKALRITSHIISLLNLVGLALDHYCAILKPLNYPTLMCRKHANIMIVLFWVVASLCGFSDFILPSAYFSYCEKDVHLHHYCMAVWCSVYTEEYIMFAVAMLSSVLIVALYTTIFVQIRRYQSFQQQYRQNMKRNRRGLVTTFIIVFTFMLTWLPYCLFDVIVIIVSHARPASSMHYIKLAAKFEFHFFNLLLLNSFLDPIIYAIRMREVQNGYRNIFPCTKQRRSLTRGMSQSTERSRYTNHNSQYSKTNQNESYL